MAVIEMSGVRKTFHIYRRKGAGGLARFLRQRIDIEAVAGIDLQVVRGEIVGYIGPNGAGKSTTVKMLTGVLTPSAGELRVLGMDPSRQRVDVVGKLGVVFGQRTQLWWDLPLTDSFELLRHIYRIPEDRYHQNLAAFTERLDLAGFIDTPVRQLSLGQRMRGDLTAAMLHDPEVLFLDEPTIGLDVVAKARIREFLEEVNQARGVTVMLTTHDMSDVERLCSRVLIIDHGRILFDGGLYALRSKFDGESVLVVDLVEPGPPLAVPGAEVTKVEGPRQWLRFRRSQTTAADLIGQVTGAARIRDLALEEPAIEEVVRRLYATRR